MVHYNTVLDILNMNQCWTPNGHLGLILLYYYTFYSRYSNDWITNTEISLGFNNSVIKSLCNFIYIFLIDYCNVLYLYELHREKSYLQSSALITN